MKEYYIQVGPNKGTHYIFENTTEAVKWLNSEDLCYLNVNKQNIENELSFKFWWDGAQFDWVKSDDGYVIQVLNKWVTHKTYNVYKNGEPLPIKKLQFFKSGNPVQTMMVRFAFGAFAGWVRSSGQWMHQRCAVAQEMLKEISHNRGSIGNKGEDPLPLGRFNTTKKQVFGYYCALYCDPFKAWDLLCEKFPEYKYKNNKKITRKNHYALVVLLMQDRYVIRQIKAHNTNMDEFKEKLQKALKKHNVDSDTIIENMAKVMNGKPGLASLKASEDLLNIERYVNDDTGKLNHDGTTKINAKIPESAKFIEVEEAKKNGNSGDLPDIPEEAKSPVTIIKEATGQFTVDDVLGTS